MTGQKSGLYIHWPYCEAICPYCDFNVYKARDDQALAQALVTALERMGAAWPDLALASIYFGGGTPGLMQANDVARLITTAQALWPSENPEITIEVNPTASETERLHAFNQAGVNRLSLGVQALEEQALKFLGRWHTAVDAHEAYKRARALFTSVSVDLIYARPGQPLKAWEAELAEILAWQLDHLSLYQLTIEPGTAFHTQVHKGRWQPMDTDRCADFYDLTQEKTAAANLPAYEISNHARPGHRSIHNQGYWQGRPYLGLGPGAHGRVFAHGQWWVTEGFKQPAHWVTDVAQGGMGLATYEPLSVQDRARERLLLGLRQTDGLMLDTDLQGVLEDSAMEQLCAQGLLVYEKNRLSISPGSRILTDTILTQIIR